MNIGFIGAGKAGTALGRYLVDHNHSVVGYASATYTSAQDAALYTESRAFTSAVELVKASDIVFITTPDKVISSVWQNLLKACQTGQFSLSSKIIAHCSGFCTSEVFSKAQSVGASVCSVHPLLAFGKRETVVSQLGRAHFSVEGDDQALDIIVSLLEAMGNTVHVLKTSDKAFYHAAAVFASNLVLAPLDTAVTLLRQCGFSDFDARSALMPLVKGNIDNFFQLGASASLTGPVERNDLATVKGHLQSLSPTQASLYCALSRALIEIAKDKHPDRCYEVWDEVLGRSLAKPSYGDGS